MARARGGCRAGQSGDERIGTLTLLAGTVRGDSPARSPNIASDVKVSTSSANSTVEIVAEYPARFAPPNACRLAS